MNSRQGHGRPIMVPNPNLYSPDACIQITSFKILLLFLQICNRSLQKGGGEDNYASRTCLESTVRLHDCLSLSIIREGAMFSGPGVSRWIAPLIQTRPHMRKIQVGQVNLAFLCRIAVRQLSRFAVSRSRDSVTQCAVIFQTARFVTAHHEW